MVRMFANSPGDLYSIPGRVIPKTLKMVLDATLLNTQHYKARIKGKVEQSRERCSAPPRNLGVEAIEKGAFGSPSTTLPTLLLLTYYFLRLVKNMAHGWSSHLLRVGNLYKWLTLTLTRLFFVSLNLRVHSLWVTIIFTCLLWLWASVSSLFSHVYITWSVSTNQNLDFLSRHLTFS